MLNITGDRGQPCITLLFISSKTRFLMKTWYCRAFWRITRSPTPLLGVTVFACICRGIGLILNTVITEVMCWSTLMCVNWSSTRRSSAFVAISLHCSAAHVIQTGISWLWCNEFDAQLERFLSWPDTELFPFLSFADVCKLTATVSRKTSARYHMTRIEAGSNQWVISADGNTTQHISRSCCFCWWCYPWNWMHL
jgi:hypothetical protein